jgi:fumarate reductase flavoprotein subunit
LQPPYAAVRAVPALFHTQGGVQVDAHARVLGPDGPIPGAYAAGGVAAGVSGRSGGYGYSSGNGLLAALGLGMLAGRHAAAHRD